MMKFVATLGAVAAVIGFAVIVSSTAQAEPFVRCPYDPSVPGAQTAYINQKTDELRAYMDDINTRVLGPLSDPERDAWAASPAGLAELAKMRKIGDSRDHLPQSCYPLGSPLSSAPYFDPAPLDPGPQGPPVMGNDVQPTYGEHTCADLNNAWEQTGKLPDGVDLLLAIKKLPGFGDVKAGQLAGCAIGQAISGNQNDANVGLCNGVAALNPVPIAPNPCPALGAGS